MQELVKLEKIKREYLSHLRACQGFAPEVLKQIRDQYGWSQEQLAERLGYTPSYISHIKTGKMKASSDMLIKLLEIGENNENCKSNTS